MNSKKPTPITLSQFIFGASLASLIPFVVFFFVAIPCSDDIFYHNFAQTHTTWGFLKEHYMTWTGRYFSNWMMAINPYSLTSNARFYPWTMLTLFLIFTSSLYFLVKTMIRAFDPGHTKAKKLAFCVMIIITALFLHRMPRTADSFYWFAGASSHLLPMSLIFCAVAVYFRNLAELVMPASGRSRPVSSMVVISILLISLVSFIVSGSNETLAVQWLFVLMFGVFYKKVIFKRWDWTLFLPLLVALIGFAILYFAPGNAVRAKELTGGHDILLLLVKPWGLIIETGLRYISIALLVVVVTAYPTFKIYNQRLPNFIKESRSLMLLGLFGLGLFALTFVPSVWTMGGLPPRRVLNNMYLIVLLYGSFLMIASAHKLAFLDRWTTAISNRFSARQLKIIFLVSILFFFNNFYAWKDLFHLNTFLNSVTQRDVLVSAANHKTELVLPPLDYFPTTFFYEDITVKTEDYRNIVFSEFYKLKSVRLSKNYED